MNALKSLLQKSHEDIVLEESFVADEWGTGRLTQILANDLNAKVPAATFSVSMVSESRIEVGPGVVHNKFLEARQFDLSEPSDVFLKVVAEFKTGSFPNGSGGSVSYRLPGPVLVNGDIELLPIGQLPTLEPTTPFRSTELHTLATIRRPAGATEEAAAVDGWFVIPANNGGWIYTTKPT